jgi:cell division protein FtsZ
MVDEKLDDQVWVTVVATGYKDGPTRRRRIEEPEGEPRVERRSERSEAPARAERPRRRERAPVGEELDVPEFIPRG